MGKVQSKTRKAGSFFSTKSGKSSTINETQKSLPSRTTSSTTLSSQLQKLTSVEGSTTESRLLRETCELILRIGSLAHQLQKERGVSSIFAGSQGLEILSTMTLLRIQTDKSLDELETFQHEARNLSAKVEDYLSKKDVYNRLMNSNTALNLSRRSSRGSSEQEPPDSNKGAPHMGPVRELITRMRSCIKECTYLEVVHIFSEVLQALIGVISNMLDDLKAHQVGPSVAAYLAFLYLKESEGMERALVGGMLSAGGRFITCSYSDLVANGGEQRANARAFRLNAPEDVLELYSHIIIGFTEGEGRVEFETALTNYKMAGVATPLSMVFPDLTSMQWFERMTYRIDKLSHIESMLANRILELGMQTDEFEINSNGMHLDNSHHGDSNPLVPTLSSHYLIDIRELDIKQEIGRGTTGSTYLACWRATKCAVKVVQVLKEGTDRDMLLKDFSREVVVLNKAHHPNICQFLGCALDPPTYCVVLEYMEGGSLYENLRNPRRELDFFSCSNQIARGMEYLHDHCQMLHRDLKSPNLLLDNSGKVKIADFGLTCLVDSGPEKTAEIGTYRWMAPEVISHESYGCPADVYSYGIVLYELLTRELPFMGVSPMKVALSVSGEGLRPEIPKITPEPVCTLISDCWHQNPSRRPTFKQVLSRLESMEQRMTPADKSLIVQISRSASHLRPKGQPAAKS